MRAVVVSPRNLCSDDVMPRRVASKYRPASLLCCCVLLCFFLLCCLRCFALLALFCLRCHSAYCVIMLRLQIEARQRQRLGEREAAPDCQQRVARLLRRFAEQHELLLERTSRPKCGVQCFSLMEYLLLVNCADFHTRCSPCQ